MKIRLNSSLLGWNALSSFIFSNALILITLGLSLLWAFIKVLLMARSYTIEIPNTVEKNHFLFILIPGMKLNNDQISDDFLLRLQRAHIVFNDSKESQQLVILGGITSNNTLSEAEVGAAYFYDQAVDKQQIILEDLSQNTLENLKNVRNIIAQSPSIIISNRYHLYRIHCLARHLKLKTFPIAAEETFQLSTKMLIECLREAYFIHWYFSGKLWLLITGDKAGHNYIS